jgi:hypothetical protein
MISRTHPRRHYLEALFGLLAVMLLLALRPALAQENAPPATVAARELPDVPLPQAPQGSGSTEQSKGTTGEIIGFMTNRSLIFPDIATSSAPLNAGEKFKLFLNESVSPATFVSSAVSAGFNQWRDVPHDYGQGAQGYGKRFGESMARGASESFFGTFITSSVLHEDPRFFPQYRPSLWGSVKYAARRIVITRTDSGRSTFNVAGFIGPIGAEALANVYLPRSEQTGAKTGERIGSDLAWKFAANMFKNYWPTLFKDLGLHKLGVIPTPTAVPATDPKSGY